MNPEPLPHTIRQDGTTVSQLWRGHSSDGTPLAVYQGRLDHFEVVVIRSQQASTKVFHGKPINFQAKELYPPASQWGILGWSLEGWDRVQHRLNLLGVPPDQLPVQPSNKSVA